MNKKITQLYHNFINANGCNPYAAICTVAYKDDMDNSFDTYITLSSSYDEENDDAIFYHANGLNDLLSLMDKKGTEDFVVTEVKGFTSGI